MNIIVDAKLSALAAGYRRRASLPGVGLALAIAGAPTRIGVAGVRARGEETRVEPDDSWHIGSITKSMTALLLGRFIAEERCTLSDRLADLTQLPMNDQLGSCTLRDLLAHRTGLASNPPRLQCLGAVVADHSAPEGEGRDAVLVPALKAPPGRKSFRYSNLGYMLAGHIAERVGGAPWKQLIRDYVATPLELATLGFGPPEGAQPRGHRSIASALLTHRWKIGEAVQAHDPTAELSDVFASAGLINFSLTDLAHYGAAVGQMACGVDGLIPARVFADLTDGKDYAGGWVLTRSGMFHTGSNGLWFAELRVRACDGAAAVFTTNIGSFRAMVAARLATRQLLRLAGG